MAYRSKPVPVFKGGDQEKGIRPGTENLPGILDKAISEITKNEKKYLDLQMKNRTLLETRLKAIGGIVVGEKVERLVNTSCVTLSISNEKLLIELDKRGFGVSRGSACHAGAWSLVMFLLQWVSQKISPIKPFAYQAEYLPLPKKWTTLFGDRRDS